MKRFLRRILESELWFWNWELRFSSKDTLNPKNNYSVYIHKYSGKAAIVRRRKM